MFIEPISALEFRQQKIIVAIKSPSRGLLKVLVSLQFKRFLNKPDKILHHSSQAKKKGTIFLHWFLFTIHIY